MKFSLRQKGRRLEKVISSTLLEQLYDQLRGHKSVLLMSGLEPTSLVSKASVLPLEPRCLVAILFLPLYAAVSIAAPVQRRIGHHLKNGKKKTGISFSLREERK